MHRDDGARSFWLFQIGGWGFYGLATFLTFLASLESGSWWGLFLFKAVVRPTAGILVSSILALGYRRLDEGDRPGSIIATAAVVGSVAGGLAWFVASGLLMRPFRPPGTRLVAWDVLPHAGFEYVFVMLAWSAAFFGVRAWRRSRERERRALQAEARATEARLRALTAQLNPHFLFNALSSSRGLVRRDPARAEAVIARLASFLRYALVQPFRPTVSLREEIDFIEAYLDVERARLGDALETVIEVEDDAAEIRVPPFLLHPLVENAVKHAAGDGNENARLTLRAWMERDRLRVEVTNPGRLSPSNDRVGTGIGLRNLRERLAHHYAGRGLLELLEEDGRVRARLDVPRKETDDARTP